MTNADKYLKDGADVEEFVDSIGNYIKEDTGHILFCVIRNFFNQPIKPTLTEAEKVILRNIYHTKNTIIGRDGEVLFLYSQDNIYCTKNYNLNLFNHLFQFIKPRRRI